MRITMVVAVMTLAGCAPGQIGLGSAPIYMYNQTTDQNATCGPFVGPFGASSETRTAAALREAQCISDYQRQGFERVPEPVE